MPVIFEILRTNENVVSSSEAIRRLKEDGQNVLPEAKGVLTDEQISQIKLQTAELEEYTFVSPEKAIPILSLSLRRSVPECLRAIDEQRVVYLDSGISDSNK